MFFVRTAMEKDLPKVRDILIETWHMTYDEIYGEETVAQISKQHHSIEKLTAQHNRPNSEFLVADNGEIIGGMAYATQEEKRIRLHQLYVLPQFHGGKTGLHLLIEIENSFMDAEVISLEVDERNLKAVKFYEKYGFKQTGSIQDCGGFGEDIPAIIMEKSVLYAED